MSEVKMSKVVSLSRARKDRAKADKRAAADANAARFGRTRVERDAEEARAAKAARDIDAHKLE